MAEQKKPTGRREFEAQIVKKAWKDAKFKKELLTNPKSVLEKELKVINKDVKLPASVKVKVVEETADTIYLVLPRNPKEVVGKDLSDKDLEAVAGGTLYGVVRSTGIQLGQINRANMLLVI
ncbi:MAG: NHLP leader peptide family RiPP precursor [Kiritimatiellae bacterium]|nr:NHLP leader peptide family RiPP precursor [Kiritimatiellia bacterium]MDD5521982.1 NHLP leader peptide family RiPP precursor [Kiritimatiellia bacterium]